MARFGEHRMEKCFEAEASKKINDLERGLNFLVAIGSLAPITGFLGTVSGMIAAFRNIANADDINAQLVANGIFEALITTAFGLTIAILAVAAYNIFTNIIDNFAKEIEQSGSDIISSILFSQNKK
ncbi:MAG TPA: MotA/TolQ/ExbB proton channel family protein [Spirochaetota bacterium]|nr:MotA/TolQ/ExbB proton channel family protein [Spirochaetota bacterium]